MIVSCVVTVDVDTRVLMLLDVRVQVADACPVSTMPFIYTEHLKGRSRAPTAHPGGVSAMRSFVHVLCATGPMVAVRRLAIVPSRNIEQGLASHLRCLGCLSSDFYTVAKMPSVRTTAARLRHRSPHHRIHGLRLSPNDLDTERHRVLKLMRV